MVPSDWSFACPDWRERLRDGRSLVPDLPLDRELASRSVAIFNKLRLPDVAGQPQLREAAGDWQRDIVAALFGSLMPNGRRMVRKALCMVPKKNSKTTGAGAIGVTALLMDPEPRQPYYIYGPTQAIAQRGFDQAEGMILADPVLKQRFHIRAHVKTIVDQVTESTLRVQTFDESVATGVIPKGMIVDELHILGKVHYAARVLGQLWGGLVSKPGGFLFMITTQSDQPPAGVFKAELQLARGIRDGTITGPGATTLPILYEFPAEFQADKERKWADSTVWPMVLPNLGRSVQLDLLEEQYAEAAEKGDDELARWASQHLNIEIGIGLHADGWRGADLWAQGAVETGLSLDEVLERSEVVVAGIDGGGLDDLFGLCVLGRERDTGKWLAWFHAYAAEIVLERRKDIATRLKEFAAQGDLTFFAKGHELTAAVLAVLKQVREAKKFPEEDAIGVDPQTIGVVIDALAADGFSLDDEKTGKRGMQVQVPQGWALSSAVWSIEFKLFDGNMIHGGSELMNWCVGNAKVEQRGNAVFVSKAVSGKAKIDPLVALFNAAKLMERGPVAAVKKSADALIASLRGVPA